MKMQQVLAVVLGAVERDTVVTWVVVGVAIALTVFYLGFTDHGRGRLADAQREGEQKRAAAKEAKANAGMPISRAGTQTAGGLACPKCGGTSFVPVRKGRMVECVTCAAQFKRG